MRAKRFRVAWLAAALVTAGGLVAGPAAGVAAADACQSWNGGQPANPATGTHPVNALTGVAGVAQCDVWAVGYTQDVNTPGSIRALIEHWTGGSWAVSTAPPLNSNTRLFGVSAVSATNIWAVGTTTDTAANLTRTLILHWNGSNWTRQTSPTPAGADGLLLGVDALSATDVWAVGQSGNGPNEVPLALHFNGTRWVQRTVPPPADGTHQVFSTVSGASGSDVWALGSTFGSPTHPVLYHWNGRAWAPQAFPVPAPGQISGIAAVSATSVWAAGYVPGANGRRQTLVMHWDGSGWSQAQAPNPGGTNFDNALSGMASSSASDVWASGWYDEGSGHTVPFVLHYDGSSWAAANLPGPSGGDGNVIGSVGVSSPGQAWVAGGFLDNSRTFASPVPVVPDVTGLSPDAAAYTLRFYGLAGPSGPLGHTTSCPVASRGQIVGSDLAPGLREPFGTPVGLTVCDAPAMVTVPNVLDFDDGSARAAITGAGLSVGSVTMTPNCTLLAGEVLTQNPSGGAQVAPGTAVNLTESTGKQANGKPCIVN
ncbi:MAG TPA: PASTA domain-containing protein [Streptosporangiaceae bacterium]|jgi:hypothetical protein|nr:PASTA domain-containing protein [Streptosporangiaceae bacterium]